MENKIVSILKPDFSFPQINTNYGIINEFIGIVILKSSTFNKYKHLQNISQLLSFIFRFNKHILVVLILNYKAC